MRTVSCRSFRAGQFCFEFSRRPRLERLARRRIDRLGILPVSFVQFENVPGIHSLERPQCHNLSILTCPTARSVRLPPSREATADHRSLVRRWSGGPYMLRATKLRMIRLIGIDVDGTLLDSEGRLPHENR